MRYLGIDYGLKKTGLALGDDETNLALPLTIVRGLSDAELIERICSIVHEECIGEILIGLPQRSREELPTIESRIRVFAQHVHDVVKVPLRFVSERWTSKEARTLLGRHTAKDEDAVAAMLIVQSVLQSVI